MTDTNLIRWCLALGALLWGSACGGGAMGQMTTQGGDATEKGGLLSALEHPLAVGGTVRPALRVEVAGSTPPPTHFVSARPSVVEVVNGNLVGRSPGMAAVLVGTDQDVLDFIHVWVAPIDRVELHMLEPNGSDAGPIMEPVELVVGESVRLIPRAYGGDQPLVGVQTSSWSVEPEIAQVLREGLPARVRLVARAPGVAKVRIEMLGKSSTIDLKVVP